MKPALWIGVVVSAVVVCSIPDLVRDASPEPVATPCPQRWDGDRTTTGLGGAADSPAPGRPISAADSLVPGRPISATDSLVPGRPAGAADSLVPGRPIGALICAYPGDEPAEPRILPAGQAGSMAHDLGYLPIDTERIATACPLLPTWPANYLIRFSYSDGRGRSTGRSRPARWRWR